MNADQLLAKNVYKQFLEKEGSWYIAGDYSIYSVFKIMRHFNIQSVLEVGMGIGCMGYGILAFASDNNRQLAYSSTENNAFCVSVIQQNLAQYFSKIKLYHSLNALKTSDKFELIIVDGSDESLHVVAALAVSNAILFVEGSRAVQVNKLATYFPKAIQAQMVPAKANGGKGLYSNESWHSGGTVIFTTPTFNQRLFYWKEKIATSFKLRILRKFGK